MPSTRITTVPTLSEAARRLPDSARAAAFVLAALALEALLARGLIGEGLSRPLILLAGVGVVAFVLRFPLPTAIFFFALTDFVFYPTFFDFHLGSISVRPHEVALVLLLLLALVRPRKETWGGTPGFALAAFLGMLALTSALAVADGRAAFSDVLAWGRPFAPLAFFYVVVRLFPLPEQRRALLAGGAILAAVAGAVALFAALGSSIGHTLSGGSESIIKEEEGSAGLLRVRFAGLSMAYALLWYVAVRAFASRGARRTGWALVLGGMALAIAISFNRNMWLGLIAGLVLMMTLGGSFIRGRFTVALVAAIAGIILLATFGTATESRVLEPVVKRGATLFNPGKVESSNSLEDRGRETRIAWPKAQENILLGIGPGVGFGVYISEFAGPHSIRVEPQLFLHNQYLYLLLICGLPGLIAFLFFLGIPLVRAFRRSPVDPAIAACGVGIAMIMLSSVVAIYFSVEDMTAVLGLLTGVIVADFEGRAADNLDAALVL